MDAIKVLRNKNFKFNKKYGQNFLTDQNLLADIVSKSGVTPNDVVVEIGVGAGTLTAESAKVAKKVYGYEIDTSLKPILKETLAGYDNVEITFKDIMQEPISELESKIGEEYIVIANLPYYITTPIIMLFIEKAKKCKAIVVMVQKEVAERLSAKSSSSDYGTITVSVNAVADTEIIKYVGREMFLPPPNVDSAVIKMVINRNKYNITDETAFKKLIKNSFLMKRKTFVNNVIKSYNISRQEVEDILNGLNLNANCRAEDLTVEDFIKLSEIIK
ncbi:MAG: ribosomal RNA small subunit methyltransferase A [Clostridia bacterium]|nr:ribosomal RNA small subunit methyltransferase A [Clostridia bacterium]